MWWTINTVGNLLLASSYNKDFFFSVASKNYIYSEELARIKISMKRLTHLGSEFSKEIIENFKLNNKRNTKEQNPFYEHEKQRLTKKCPSKNFCFHFHICGKNSKLFTFKIRHFRIVKKRGEIYFGYQFYLYTKIISFLFKL